MSARVIKATDTERAAYAATGAVYPLYGWVLVDGHRCAVEDLHGSWRAPYPVYELRAPDGFLWGAGMYTHGQLAHTLRGVAQDAKAGLVPEYCPQCGLLNGYDCKC